jgi:hypothetical protein
MAQALAMRTSPSVSPRMSHLSPRSQRQSVDPQRPDERLLPSRDVTDAMIDDAYVAFILYANPGVPSSTDTSELRKIFRVPPRSDGKSFSIYTLWELIRKLENKELKTWTQLAIDLGVEPPQAEKNQSTQKVQQYAVRLKRWMHAMHVDAFFEYLLGKPHSYYTQLPTSAIHTPDSARDGVPLEEDLALRALMPEWKPKRGRRKAEDKEGSIDRDLHSAKRQHLETPASVIDYDGYGGHSANFPQSAIPPWSGVLPDDQEPWTAPGMFPMNVPSGQSLTHPFAAYRGTPEARWRMLGRDFSPAGAYPQSAITPGHRPAQHIAHAEPQSAITPSASGTKTKARRRHGPAVSSAWPSSGNPSTGKLRGRPPSNRNIQDGPFSTFPANPKPSSQPSSNAVDPDSVPTPTIERDPNIHPGAPLPVQGSLSSNRLEQIQRRNKLQLQVPQHSGGPVRMATPPTVLVNGETDGPNMQHYTGRRESADFFNDPDEHESNAGVSQNGHPRGSSPLIDFGFRDISRVFATKVLQAKLVPQQEPLSVEDAKAISNQVVLQVIPTISPTQTTVSLIKLAIWLGVGKEFGLGDDNPSTLTVKASTSSGSKSANPHKDREFQLQWSLSHGKFASVNLHIKNLILPASSQGRDMLEKDVMALRKELGKGSRFLDESDGDGDVVTRENASEGTWRERYLKLRKEMRGREREMKRYRRRILEAVMADEEVGRGND